MLAFVCSRQIQILRRSFLCFLDEPVKKNHSVAPIDVKQHSRNAILRQPRSHFINRIPERPTNGHPDGPAKLDSLDILANPLPVLRKWQLLQPISDGFAAGLGPIEDRRNTFALVFRSRSSASAVFAFLTHTGQCTIYGTSRRAKMVNACSCCRSAEGAVHSKVAPLSPLFHSSAY